MGEIGDHVAVHLEVDASRSSRRAANAPSRSRPALEAAEPRDIGRQFQDLLVVDTSFSIGPARPYNRGICRIGALRRSRCGRRAIYHTVLEAAERPRLDATLWMPHDEARRRRGPPACRKRPADARGGRGGGADADRLGRRRSGPGGPDRYAAARRQGLRGVVRRLRHGPGEASSTAPSRTSGATTTSCWCATSRSSPTASTTWRRSSARPTSPTIPPNGVVGMSKLARVVEIFARRLQTQETHDGADRRRHHEACGPRGVAVMIEAEHQCMTMRGVHKPARSTVTTQFTGVFKTTRPSRSAS